MSTAQPLTIGVVIHRQLADQLFTPHDRARLDALGTVRWTTSTTPISTAEAIELLRDCQIGLGSWGTPKVDAALLAGCPKLRLWEHVAGTVKGMFGPHLDGRELTIASCKGAIADGVAEMTVGQIIIGLRDVLANAANNRAGTHGKVADPRLLCTSRVGVIGASEVGRRVIALLRPFGCRIAVFDPFLSDADARQMGVEPVRDLTALCASCDAITLHTPLLDATRKLVGAAQFAAMRPRTVFINTSRGECVDETALIAAVQSGKIAAFLDVTHPEPCAKDSPLRSLPNVVLTSHIAGPATVNLGKQAVDDVAAFVAGGQPACVVRADMLHRVA